MRIHLLGTGGVFSERLSPCFVVDEKIMMEVPNGASKMLIRQNERIENIALCLISHLHADHVWDIPFLLLHKNYVNGEKMTIVGPRGIKEYMGECLKMAYPTLSWEKIVSKTIDRIIEIEDDTKIDFRQYHISAFGVYHGGEKCFGYSIDNGTGKVFAYSGDSILCQGVYKLAKDADVCCVDVNDIKSSQTHMGADDIVELKKNYPNTRFYAVHTQDWKKSMNNYEEYFVIPNDGTVIDIE